MRNIWRIAAFDIVAPLAAGLALVMIGIELSWPLWWTSVCSVLCLLILQAVAVNFVLARRDTVTVGTDDDGPGLRTAVVAVATAALVACAVVGYQSWSVPDRDRDADMAEVVRIASSMCEATASFSPQNPNASIDKAAAFMVPEQADKYKKSMGQTAAELKAGRVSAQAQTVSAGIEAISTEAASVAVVIRSKRDRPNAAPEQVVLALRVTLTREGADSWRVFDVGPIDPGPSSTTPTSTPPPVPTPKPAPR